MGFWRDDEWYDSLTRETITDVVTHWADFNEPNDDEINKQFYTD